MRFVNIRSGFMLLTCLWGYPLSASQKQTGKSSTPASTDAVVADATDYAVLESVANDILTRKMTHILFREDKPVQVFVCNQTPKSDRQIYKASLVVLWPFWNEMPEEEQMEAFRLAREMGQNWMQRNRVSVSLKEFCPRRADIVVGPSPEKLPAFTCTQRYPHVGTRLTVSMPGYSMDKQWAVMFASFPWGCTLGRLPFC